MEAMPVHRIGLGVVAGLAQKNFSGNAAGHFAHVRAGLDQTLTHFDEGGSVLAQGCRGQVIECGGHIRLP